MNEDWREDGPLDKAAENAARLGRAAGQMEQVAHSMQVAHAAAGTAAAGGTASGAAAGTALGGPLGTMIGALASHKTFWKVIGSVFLTIILFAVIIVNAVGILLSYLGFSDADSYVNQARQAEYQIIKNRIDTLFTEDTSLKAEILAMIEAESQVQADKIWEDYNDNQSGYDGYEIDNEWEQELKPKLSQYLAVLIEEEWSGSQIVGFNGQSSFSGISGTLTSPYDTYFSQAAATYQVPEALLKAIAKEESGFDPHAVSPAGAVGIMQLMPSTAANLGVMDLYDPKQNIMGGAKYVAEMIRTFASYPNALDLALASYNAGTEAVKKAGYRIPQNGETPAFVEKVKSHLVFEQEGTSDATENTETLVSGTNEVSAVQLKGFVEERVSTFLGWTQTGTHTETEGSGEEEIEYEIVDYAIVVRLNPELSETETGYQYRYVMDQTSFQYMLKLFEVAAGGKEYVESVLFQVSSWKNYILGSGASEDSYTSTISTVGDQISYETVAGCVKEVEYYNQGEEPWASLPYGGSNIKASGCGPTAIAIVISTLTGEHVTPEMTGKFAIDHGYYVRGKGTSHAYPSAAAKHWGLEVARMKREQMPEVVKGLKQGKLAVVICAENTISKSGHYIVLTGITADGYLTIADPGSRSRTGMVYGTATIQSYARNLADGSIWLIGD